MAAPAGSIQKRAQQPATFTSSSQRVCAFKSAAQSVRLLAHAKIESIAANPVFVVGIYAQSDNARVESTQVSRGTFRRFLSATTSCRSLSVRSYYIHAFT